MKKWAVILAVIMLFAILAPANAAVPSISTSDTTKVVSITVTNSTTESEGFRIFEVESAVAIQQEIRKLYDFVNETEERRSPIEFFEESVQEKIREQLPEEIPLDSLLINEIISVDEVNYDTQYGDVNVEFEFATTYEVGKTVCILLALTYYVDVHSELDEDTELNENTEWVTLEAIALENGHLLIVFPQDVLLKMEQASATTMIVLNEQ